MVETGSREFLKPLSGLLAARFRISDFGLLSDLGLRVSDLANVQLKQSGGP
jgi:hypothetical protein